MVHTAAQIHGPHIDAESAASPSAEIQQITMHMMADDFDEESKPSSEWIEQWRAHTDCIAALESSDNPLQQLLANIEVLDSTLCLMGQMLMEEHDRFIAMIEPLTEVARPETSFPLVALLEPMAFARLPTLILNMHAARRMVTHARMQVQAYPDLVDCQDIPCNAGADFNQHVIDPPVTGTLDGLDTAAGTE